MKLIILGGFLGSGKTSILIPFAQELSTGGETTPKNIVIIENEIGQVGIDSTLTEGCGFVTKNLFNGCVCCTIAGTLIESLRTIRTRIEPDYVILETTGLAMPDSVANQIWDYYDAHLSITLITVVDAERWLRITKHAQDLAYDQLLHADYVFLNKTDRVDPETLQRVREDVIEKAGKCEIYEVSKMSNPSYIVSVCREICNNINREEKHDQQK